VFEARLDVSRFLDSLVQSGRWKSVELHQYGPHWGSVLAKLNSVRVIMHEPVPWDGAQQEAARLHAAVVIGNRDRTLLPSKAVDYLTLPVPRIAITNRPPRDALAEYVEGKPGWLSVAVDTPLAASMVHEHLSRSRTAEELTPPASESWDAVAGVISTFVARCLHRACNSRSERSSDRDDVMCPLEEKQHPTP
jgi:hypothetical protein